VTVSDGRQAAAIALLGNYMAGIVTTADGHGGTLLKLRRQDPITDPVAPNGGSVELGPVSPMFGRPITGRYVPFETQYLRTHTRPLDRCRLEGDKLEVAVKNGRWVLTHRARGPATGGGTVIFRTTGNGVAAW